MKPINLLVGLLFYSTLLLPPNVHAAPFCAVFSYGKQCWYYTYEDCLRAAGPHGACVINDEDVRPPSGDRGAPFCVVTAYGIQCWYYDAESCRRAAATTGGACVVNPNK